MGTIIDDDPAPNNPPVAVNDTVAGTYGLFVSVSVSVLANDSDPDGDPLTVTNAVCGPNCLVSISGGTTLTITGLDGGTQTAVYTVSDGRGGTDTASVFVTYFNPCGNFLC